MFNEGTQSTESLRLKFMITTPTEISLDFNQITQVKFGRILQTFSFANPNHNTQPNDFILI